MSKIAKALELAKEARLSRARARGAPDAEDTSAAEAPARRPPPPVRRKPGARIGHDIVRRKSSRELIRTMAEVEPLSNQELAAGKIIYPEMANQRVLNAFRDLRTTLLGMADSSNFSCLVTSVVPKGGASFVATNLAVAFALDASRTSLLIDCNLKAPNRNLPISDARIGLTQFLENENLKVSDIIRASGIRRLRVIAPGERREIPAEYFSSARMMEFLQEVQERYKDRYIFLDGPSTNESADVKLLSSLCDYVLLVVPYGKVSPSQIEMAARTVDESKLIGAVFNKEPY